MEPVHQFLQHDLVPIVELQTCWCSELIVNLRFDSASNCGNGVGICFTGSQFAAFPHEMIRAEMRIRSASQRSFKTHPR